MIGAALFALTLACRAESPASSPTSSPTSSSTSSSTSGTNAQPATTSATTPAPAQAPTAHALSRLRVQGTHFVTADGQPFAWRGITAFRLVDLIADGQEAEAVRFLDWAAGQKLTVVRVLTMMGGLFQLAPEEGRRALPRLLELAAARRIYVEVVALAGTADIAVDLPQHIREIARILEAHPNGVLEIANEPVHPSQSAAVQKPETLQALAALVPREIPVSLGSIERGDGFGEGTYLTWHSPRESRSGGWGHVLALAEGASLLSRWKKPVVSDEPIGAGAELQPGRRDNDPSRFRAAAVLTRLTGLGATFHYEGGLLARIPEGRELECFIGWNDAWTLLPPDVERRGIFRIGGGPDGVAAAFDKTRLLGVYERVDQTAGWVLALGDQGAPLTLREGWSARETRNLPGGRLISAAR